MSCPRCGSPVSDGARFCGQCGASLPAAAAGDATAGPAGERRQLTVLFSDIVGFTTFAEKTDTADLVEVLAVYLDAMSEVIRGANGTVDKFIGDAIMAFWGAPSDDPEHAVHACRAALEMTKKLGEIDAFLRERGLPRLDMRVGVNTGEVIVGNIGSPDRMNYTVVGDSVNLASRLEGLNRFYGSRILIGEATAQAVADTLVVRPLEWVAVKGKDKVILIYELLGEVDEVDEATQRAVHRYQEGLERYRERRFAEAAALFEEASTLFGGDAAAERLGGLARRYVDDPPDEDWDGRSTMNTK